MRERERNAPKCAEWARAAARKRTHHAGLPRNGSAQPLKLPPCPPAGVSAGSQSEVQRQKGPQAPGGGTQCSNR